jgi:hypothetical protein
VKIDFDQGPTLGVLSAFSQVFVFSADGEGAAPVAGAGVILPHSRARRIASILNGE